MSEIKKSTTIDKDSEAYIDKFYHPTCTAYDFASLFCAINSINEIYSFERDNLIKFISGFKSRQQFDKILQDINLRSNGIHYYSNDLEEAIAKLKLGGILYTVSPERNSEVCIFKNIPISSIIENRLPLLDEMVDFTKKYNSFILEDKKEVQKVYK